MNKQLDPKFVAAYAEWLGVTDGEAYALLEAEPLIEVGSVQGAGWDESEHPRHPAGSEQGGEFRPKDEPPAGGMTERERKEDFAAQLDAYPVGTVIRAKGEFGEFEYEKRGRQWYPVGHGGGPFDAVQFFGNEIEVVRTRIEEFGSDRDPKWEAEPIGPVPTVYEGQVFDAVDHSDRVWAGEVIPHFGYTLYDRPGNYGPEYREAVSEELARIGEEGDLRLTTPAEIIPEVISGGRFQSQFESGTSGGVFAPDVRAMQEKMFFGYPEDIPPELRPIYGWLDHPDMPERRSQFQQYGNATWYVKPEVKGRTTLTAVDSLSRPVIPGPIRNPGWRATVPPGYSDLGVSMGEIGDHLTEGGLFDDLLETQYHGGLSLGDVEQVDLELFDGFTVEEQFGDQWEALRELREDYGILVRFVDDEGEEISLFEDEDR